MRTTPWMEEVEPRREQRSRSGRHENGFRFYARSLIQIPLVRRLGCVTVCFGV